MAEKFVPDKRTRKKHRRLSGGRQYTRKTIQSNDNKEDKDDPKSWKYNKMEIKWINKLEAQIEKIQQMFNKDPEEIKNTQFAINNTTEI